MITKIVNLKNGNIGSLLNNGVDVHRRLPEAFSCPYFTVNFLPSLITVSLIAIS